jgi:hypothetical protein
VLAVEQDKEKLMQKKENFKKLNAEFKKSIRDWLIHGTPLNNVAETPDFHAVIVGSRVNYYDSDERRQLKIKTASAVLHKILDASIKEAEFRGEEFALTNHQAIDCLAQAEAIICENGFSRLIDGEIKPVAFSNDDCYCFHRLEIPRLKPPKDWIEGPRNWEHLGPFMNSIREAMADFEEETGESLMFRRLLSAIGQLLWDSKASREIIYWYGKGGDGKTTLCNYIAGKLGDSALPNLRPKCLESEYYLAQLEGKRMVIAEEAGKGQFLTEGIKAITGNRFITGRHPHERIRTFESHVMIWYTSNELPIIDGEHSSKDRLRLIQSEPRKNRARRDEADIIAELDIFWPHIIDMAVTEYHAAGMTVWPMPDDELTDSVDAFYLDADGWIEANLVYEEGAFMPSSTIKYLLNHKVSLKNVEARIQRMEPAVCDVDAKITKGRRRMRSEANPVFGWQNVGLAIGHYQALAVPWIAGPKRR